MKNTEIILYCTHIEYGDFYKSFFQTIVEGELIDYELDNWLDNIIPSICNDFDLSLVLDWVIILSKYTDEPVSNVTKFKNSIKGKLIFKEPEIIEEEPIEEIIEEEPIEEKEPINKVYRSCWIEPCGNIHYVGFSEHNEFASEWILENEGEDAWEKSLHSDGYFYEYLQNKGWVRILGWTKQPSFVLPNHVSPSQVITIREYCISECIDYTIWPEILKS